MTTADNPMSTSEGKSGEMRSLSRWFRQMYRLHGDAEYKEAADTIDALQAQVEVLKKALQPFSDAAGVYFAKHYNKIDCIDDHYGTILAGSLFEARAAIRSRSNATGERDVCAEMRARCEHCGGTGDVHRMDGEYLGRCNCAYGSSPVGFSDEEVEELAFVIWRAQCEHCHAPAPEHIPTGMLGDHCRVFARAVLTHLRAQRKGSDADVLTARSQGASPISQEGSIAPEALSEGGDA